MNAYNEIYLDDNMTAVGAMLDYAVNSCGEDITLFYARFLASGIASQLARANPCLLGRSGVELARLVAERTGPRLPDEKPFIDIGSPEYWAGWTLAYVSWYLNIDYSVLQACGISIVEMLSHYPSLHEADLSKSVAFVREAVRKSVQSRNPLKTARENAGFTQESLAEMSGTSKSAIRSYEQQQRRLASASAETVRSLQQATGCDMAYLMMS